MGRGVGHHRPHALLHQPHAAARGAGDLAGAALRAACCRATCRSSTRSTRATSTSCASSGPRPTSSSPRVSLIDEHRGRRVRMGHLAFLGSHRVNGVSALHTDLMRKTVFKRPAPPLSRPHRQQDQRHHLPPLAASGQSRPDRARSSTPAAKACSTTRRRSSSSRTIADDAGAAGGGRRDPPHQQGDAGAR